jgi:hypothetical protein
VDALAMMATSMLGAVRLLERQILTLRRAGADPRLRGAPLPVFLLLNHELDDVEFRPVKVVAIAAELRVKARVAAKALRRLTEAGYLEAGPNVGRVGTYRLRWHPANDAIGPKRHQ